MQWEQITTEVLTGVVLVAVGYVVRLVYADLRAKNQPTPTAPCPTPEVCQGHVAQIVKEELKSDIKDELKEHIDLRFDAGFAKIRAELSEFKAELPQILNGRNGYLRKPEWIEARTAQETRIEAMRSELADLKDRVGDLE